MSKHSRISGSVSPLVWLVPVPFLLAIFLPLDLPRSDAQQPVRMDRVARAPERVQPQDAAASAARSPR